MEENLIRQYTFTTPCRVYSKGELASLYFPRSTPASASKQLMQWIKLHLRLYECLKQCGYQPNQKMFTPNQVRYILYCKHSVNGVF